MKGLLTMSPKEVDRVSIMEQVVKKTIKQKKAAKILGLSVRQIIRLKKRYRQEGTAGLVHKDRGRVSHNRIPAEEIKRVTDIIKERYWDFGPTLAWEKLAKHRQVSFSVETLRKAMIETEIWQVKKRRVLTLHQLRERRTSEGELVQLDASPHAWFEDRGLRCNLLAFIDDATGRVKWLEFFKSEDTIAYFKAGREYLLRYGKPLALYADKNSIFRINSSKAGISSVADSQGLTQFNRVMKQLGIELIFAHSAQAKGRVERLFETLQDRLVKELRLKGISDLKTANRYLPEFAEEFNQRFGIEAKDARDSHLPLLAGEKKNLSKILAFQEKRILSKNLICQFENKYYQIKTKRPTYALRHAPVLVIKDLEGKIMIEYKGKPLLYEIFRTQPKARIADAKQLNQIVDQIRKEKTKRIPWKPAADHPWRHAFTY